MVDTVNIPTVHVHIVIVSMLACIYTLTAAKVHEPFTSVNKTGINQLKDMAFLKYSKHYILYL